MLRKMVLNVCISLAITYFFLPYGILCSCISEVSRQGFNRSAEFDHFKVNPTDTRLLYKSLRDVELSYCILLCYKEGKCAALLHDKSSSQCQLLTTSLTLKERLLCHHGFIYLVKENAAVNVARGKSVIMSSSLDQVLQNGNFAADGKLSFGDHYFAVTQFENSPWLKIDLKYNYPIYRVNVFNRINCCGDRLHDLIIKIGTTSESFPAVCGTFKGPGTEGQEIEIVCSNVAVGRFVLLQIEGKSGETNNMLNIDEVEVFAKLSN